ncbi:McrC family protein [Nitratiruptor tergarcus]|uniref:5-methylcytosine-specific restriction enzyme subunit McrC n=1 Tax=Nitratiruptor tergarcus DSM 16512 TaxID=1069081 RepID=A0A1W1WQB2_9BACT|nr:McrC family protein [Nitratiruptor tergarcus]SMC08412.1 5-methylcytosine-specific restriction enzyme subunit McrC [Nitratiruptor tergarcus DSM 16512]
MKNKIHQVIEYEPIKEELVGEKAFKELEAFAQDNENLILGYSRKGVLKAQNYVGIIQTKSGFTLEILPKIAKENEAILQHIQNDPNISSKYQNLNDNKQVKEYSKEILIKMLKTLKNSPFKYSQKANLKTKNLPLLEIFIEMFLSELDLLVKKGIKNDYITKTENQHFLKGKLKIKEQITKNFIHKERFYVEYDEYLPNRIENRIIKTTLSKLIKISKSSKNQQRLRECLFVFDGIDEIKNIKSAFAKIKNDRTMSYYQNVLLWSKLFLLNQSFTPYKGNSVAFALLFDMNMLFESYVGDFFKKKLRKKKVKLQDKQYHLFDEPKKYSLKPDIVIDDGAIILDTKWKIIKEGKDISQNDLYQMFAYASKYKECKRVYLIYPYFEKIRVDILRTNICAEHKDVVVRAIFFDLIRNRLRA